MPYAYRKDERIRKNTEFVATMKGKRLSADGLSLFYRKNERGSFRVGISVGKKVANAVGRNRLRRRLRGCISRVIGENAAGYDLVFVARPGLGKLEFAGLLGAVVKLIGRSGVIGRGTTEGSSR